MAESREFGSECLSSSSSENQVKSIPSGSTNKPLKRFIDPLAEKWLKIKKTEYIPQDYWIPKPPRQHFKLMLY